MTGSVLNIQAKIVNLLKKLNGLTKFNTHHEEVDTY